MKTGIFALLIMYVIIGAAALEVPFSKLTLKSDANLLGEYVRVDPDDKKPEKLVTRSWIWQDEDDLCVLFEAEIDERFAIGNKALKDAGTYGDFLRVQLITIPDAYYAYYYVGYANGSLLDAVRSHSTGLDYQWNSGYSYQTSHTDSLWTLLMRIPLGELRFEQKLPYNWKIILTRWHDATEESYSQPYANAKDGKDYYLKGQDITLNHKVKRGLDIKFKPYLVKSYDLVSKSTSFEPDNLGMDIALNPGQRTRIKLSFNPDFSDVPPDDAADDYNSKYPPYYEENRFFFTEDIDAFGVSEQIFYTRNIAQPRFAWKITGNHKALNYGVLGALDKEIRDEGEIINRGDYYQVMSLIPNWRRLQFRQSLVSRVNKGYYSHVYNGSASWEFVRNFHISGAYYGSLRRDDGDGSDESSSGYVFQGSLSAGPGNWSLSLSGSQVSRDFSPDAGYWYDTDARDAAISVSWTSDPKTGYIRMSGFGSTGWWGQQHISEEPLDEHSVSLWSYLRFRPKYMLSLQGGFSKTHDLYDQSHDTFHSMGYINFSKWKEMNFSVGTGYSLRLIYALSETFMALTPFVTINGMVGQNLSYSLRANYYSYDYEKENTVIIGGNPYVIRLDNRYAIVNAAVSYTFDTKAMITTGLGFTSYERSSEYANLSIYGNLRYEFLPEYFLYLGAGSNQSQISPSSYSDPMGEFRKNSATAYAKVAITL